MANEFRDAAHRASYLDALEKEIVALEQRLKNIAEDDPLFERVKAEVEAGVKAAKAEIARVKRAKGTKADDEPAEEKPAEE